MSEPTAAASNKEEVVQQIGDQDAAAIEKRRHTRYRVSLPVHIKLSSGAVAKAKAVDISVSGVYIEYGASAETGKVFDMRFDLPFADDFKQVLVRGEAIRSVVIGGKDVFGIAFNFIEFARETDKVLESYLDLRGIKQGL
jgi:hypothetical protein